MENLSTYNFSISRLKEYFPAASRTGIGEDLCLLNVRFDENIHPLEHPFRLEGVLLLYCIKGNMRMSINLNEYVITDNSLILCTPQNILKVADIPYPEKKSLHYVVIAMSQKFASELRLDFKRIIYEGMPLAEAPVATLSEEAKEMVARYLELVAGVSKSDMKLKDEALRSLMSSLFCIVAGIWMEKMDELKVASAQTTTRSRMIFEHFIRLVSEYHTIHRNVGFYADKLCLTPKYLSKLIKTASGKSAPEWIDSYVILEAKNLLKYSDITIKEIVYRLNFPNQSVFYKFFKARTGMTPSEYRNS